MELHLTATESHLPYGITQCYLPADTSEHNPAFNPSHACRYSIYLPRRDGRLSWPSWLGGAPAGSRTSDLAIASPTLNHRTTETTWSRNVRTADILCVFCFLWWIGMRLFCTRDRASKFSRQTSTFLWSILQSSRHCLLPDVRRRTRTRFRNLSLVPAVVIRSRTIPLLSRNQERWWRRRWRNPGWHNGLNVMRLGSTLSLHSLVCNSINSRPK